jgi:hypothetical protein
VQWSALLWAASKSSYDMKRVGSRGRICTDAICAEVELRHEMLCNAAKPSCDMRCFALKPRIEVEWVVLEPRYETVDRS